MTPRIIRARESVVDPIIIIHDLQEQIASNREIRAAFADVLSRLNRIHSPSNVLAPARTICISLIHALDEVIQNDERQLANNIHVIT